MDLRFLFVILLIVNNAHGQGAAPPPDPDPNVKETKQVFLYRLINWCVVGRGEYGLNEWPLSQFKPILLQTHKNEKQFLKETQDHIDKVLGSTGVDPWSKYDLEVGPIKCTGLSAKGLGDGDNFLHRLHIQFKAKSPTDLIPFQGLLIQAVHAPFGLGFPFGVFDTDHEFQCKVCEFTRLSRIVGCISRSEFSPLHPTVAMFHFKLRGPEDPSAAGGGGGGTVVGPALPTEREYGYQSELHWNFKWANVPCSSSRLVEFWVMMVLDFERQAWTIKKFGPYDLNDYTYASNVETPKKTTIGGGTPPLEQVQTGFPTPIIPECYGFKNNPLIITDRGRPHACFRNYKSYSAKMCAAWERQCRKPPGPPPPVPPPSPAEPPSCQTPAAHVNEMDCHGGGSGPLPALTQKKSRIRVVGDFDVQCIRRYPGTWSETMFGKKQRPPVGKICPEWQGKIACGGGAEDFSFDKNTPTEGPLDDSRSFPGSHCTACIPVTEEVTEEPSDQEPFFKRQYHGVFMIYAFFFFNPVSLNVARFYKETLHEKQYKGWRLWLVIHVGFAALASMFSYIGYTYPAFKEWDAHITLGYGAMVGVSSGVITGWFRHKNRIMQSCMFYLHALSGYLGWGLATASMVYAPLISQYTRFVSYGASGICLAAMAIMSLHICAVDSSMGLRPKRSHLPIIEIRFDDVVPPKAMFRKIFLYIYIGLQFIICFGMLVL